MIVTFVMLHGGSEIMEFQGMTVESLVNLADREGLSTHPRLTRIEIVDSEDRLLMQKHGFRAPWAAS